jgi:Protein of unknown function (DUF2807).
MAVFASCTKDVIVSPSGVRVREAIQLSSDFDEIDISNDINVIFTDSVSEILVDADEAVLPYLTIEIADGELELYYYGCVFHHCTANDATTVWVPFNSTLNEVKLSGASLFYSVNDIVASSFSMKLSGASEANCWFDMPDGDLDIKLSGASELYAYGSVDKLKAKLSGASAFTTGMVDGLYDFDANECDVNISGASLMRFHTDGIINGHASGASDIYYTGNGLSAVSCSGSSKVHHE